MKVSSSSCVRYTNIFSGSHHWGIESVMEVVKVEEHDLLKVIGFKLVVLNLARTILLDRYVLELVDLKYDVNTALVIFAAKRKYVQARFVLSQTCLPCRF